MADKTLTAYCTSYLHGFIYPSDYRSRDERDIGLFKCASRFEKDGNTLVIDGGELLQLEATQAANSLDEAQLEIRLAESSLAAADENLRLSRRQYEAGVETLSDHLEAQAMWQQAHRTEVEARIDGYLRWLEYRKAAGLLE